MSIDMTTNPWHTLGVHRKSTPEEIKAAWKDVMRRAHPDAGGTEALAAQANLAYKILTTPTLLKSYIDTLTVLGHPCTYCSSKGFTYKQQGLTARVITGCTACGGRGILVKDGL